MRAIVVSGILHYERFLPDCAIFLNYLRNQLKLRDSCIDFYGFNERLRDISICEFLTEAVNKADDREVIVIYYSGHGKKAGWQAITSTIILYKTIFRILSRHKGPIIFINDCCCAMAAAKFSRLLRGKNLILGLAPSHLEGYVSVLDRILNSWRKRKPANPMYPLFNEKTGCPTSFSLRSGDNIDYFCYPKK